ncbi:MAG TPA: F0F1 ATP synthase subunit epsilon [Terriglobia bacterium]|nr:F0F1 ATP synthase subunit epsilon [Terriglobia bacterium]
MADMIPTKIRLQVVTPDREIAEEEVDEVSIPGKEGYLGALPGHAPLLTELQAGTLEYRQDSKRHYVAIHWGFAEVLPDRVIVLAEIAERAEDIDVERAESKRKRVEEYLKSHPATDPEIEKARDDLRRAICRLETARHARS